MLCHTGNADEFTLRMLFDEGVYPGIPISSLAGMLQDICISFITSVPNGWAVTILHVTCTKLDDHL